MTPAELDKILTLQLAVAWAGEGETRLRWWRTALNDPGAGEDLIRRVAPATWRWATLKQSGIQPAEALPRLSELTLSWSREGFEAWLREDEVGEPAKFTPTATGRRLTGETPASPTETVRRLASALLPLADAYPVPHFRVAR